MSRRTVQWKRIVGQAPDVEAVIPNKAVRGREQTGAESSTKEDGTVVTQSVVVKGAICTRPMKEEKRERLRAIAKEMKK